MKERKKRLTDRQTQTKKRVGKGQTRKVKEWMKIDEGCGEMRDELAKMKG